MNGSLLASISHNMPADLQVTLSDQLKLCFEHNVFMPKDSAKEGEVRYEAIHLAYYNRHVMHVRSSLHLPSKVDPALVLPRGTRLQKQFNPGCWRGSTSLE